MSSCLSEQLLPGKWITGEENSCYPNSSLPTTQYPLIPVHDFLCTCTMLILIWHKICEFFSTLTRRAGNFLFQFLSCMLGLTFQTALVAFCSNFCAAFFLIQGIFSFLVWRIYHLCFDYFSFSLILKEVQYQARTLYFGAEAEIFFLASAPTERLGANG